jgi:hypothetical protein
MEFLITVALSFTVIMIALLVFWYIGVPVYRVEAINIERLIQAVLAEDATIADWDIFTGMVIVHNPELDRIRVQCGMLEVDEMIERQGRVIFSANGRRSLEKILNQLSTLRDVQY